MSYIRAIGIYWQDRNRRIIEGCTVYAAVGYKFRPRCARHFLFYWSNKPKPFTAERPDQALLDAVIADRFPSCMNACIQCGVGYSSAVPYRCQESLSGDNAVAMLDQI